MATQKKYTYEIRQIDAWSDGEGGWTWNDSSHLGEFTVTEGCGNDKRAFLRALKNFVTLPRGKFKVDYDGSIYEVVKRKTGEPIFAAIPINF